MSLRVRVGIATASVVAICLVLLGVAVVTSTRSDLMGALQDRLAVALQKDLAGGPPPDGAPAPTGNARGLTTAHLVVDAQGGSSVAEPAGPASDPLPLPELSPEAVARLRSGAAVVVPSTDPDLSYLALGAPTGDGRLEVEAAPLTEIDEAVSSLTTRILVGGLVTLVLGVLAVALIVRRDLRPLEDVIETADAVAAGRQDQRIPTDRGPTEVRRLSASLDRMLVQQQRHLVEQEQSQMRLQRFVSDASHELQTPITSIRGWAELSRSRALDAEGTAMALSRIEAEARRMSSLVENLLLLARLDEQRGRTDRIVDVVAVVNEAVADARAAEPDRLFELSVPDRVSVNGDEQALRQVVDNLLRNVRTHTPARTPASVDVTVADGYVVLRVSDRGPGLDDEALAHVFERFWRGDPSRARTTGGSGLGLAITASLAESLGGTVQASNRPGGGACFTVSLPITAEA